jgi:hypothetical protein
MATVTETSSAYFIEITGSVPTYLYCQSKTPHFDYERALIAACRAALNLQAQVPKDFESALRVARHEANKIGLCLHSSIVHKLQDGQHE